MAFNPDIPQPKKAEQNSSSEGASFEGEKSEQAQEGWLTLRAVAKLTEGVNSTRSVEKAIQALYNGNKELQDPQWMCDVRGRKFLHYPPEVVSYINSEIEKLRSDESKIGDRKNTRLIARELGLDRTTVSKILKKYYEDFQSADSPRELLIKGIKVKYHSNEAVEYVKSHLPDRVKISEGVPEGWKSVSELQKGLSVNNQSRVRPLIKNFLREDKNLSPREFISAEGKRHYYYPPELVRLIEQHPLLRVGYPPEGWMSIRDLSQQAGLSLSRVSFLLKDVYSSNSEIKIPQKFEGQYRVPVLFYPPEAIAVLFQNIENLRQSRKEVATKNLKIKEQRAEHRNAPDGWMTKVATSRQFGISETLVKKVVEPFRSNHPEWFHEFKDRSGSLREYHHPDLIEKVREVLANRPDKAPEGWLTTISVATVLGIGTNLTKSLVNSYRATHPEWFGEYQDRGGRTTEHYHTDLVEQIRGKLLEEPEYVPEGWEALSGLAKKLGRESKVCAKIAEQYRETHPEWFKGYKSKQSQVFEYYHPVLVEKIQQGLSERPSKAPKGWVTNSAIAEDLNISKQTCSKIADQYRESQPGWFQEFEIVTGRVNEHYHPDLVHKIQEEIARRPEKPPVEWRTFGEIAQELNSSHHTCKEIADQYRKSHPEWFREYLTKNNNIGEYCHPDLIQIIKKKFFEKPEYAPDGWITNNGIADSLGTAEAFVKKIAEPFKDAHPEWFQEYLDGTRKVSTHYHPNLVEKIIERISLRADKAPEGWMTNSRTGDELGIAQNTTEKIANSFRDAHPEWFQVYSSKVGRSHEYYHPDLIEKIREEISNRPEYAPVGWMTSEVAAAHLSLNRPAFRKIADQFRESHPDWFRDFQSKKGQIFEHYHPDLIERVEDIAAERPTMAPEGWLTNLGVAKKLETSERVIKNIASQALESHPEWFRDYLDGTRKIVVHYHPDLITQIKQVLDEKVNNSELVLKERLENRFQNKEDLKGIQNLISLFGSSQSLDILYALHPEYQGIPVEKVKSILAEYLGDYLLTPAPFSVESLKGAEALFGTPSLMEGLAEVIKRDALEKTLSKRELGIEQNIALFRDYFNNLRTEAQNIASAELMQTILSVEKFYISILSVEVPVGMVDGLKEGREFPDIYQRINIREIEAKKRVLIADEMGAGKSASAILAKEHLGVETALVVVPSNAIDTWQGYLSDKIDENSKQVGYFKKEPRVLRITDVSQLDGIEKGLYDYIIISHERLTAEYTQALETLDYGMLIVDEVHKFKNIETGVRSEHLLRLADNKERDEKYVAMLSGTPVPNKVEDVAMLLKLMYPERFAETDSRTLTRSIIHGDLLDIRQLLIPRLQMKSLGEHLEMPNLTEQVSSVELTPSEEEIYQVLLDEDELTPTEKMQMLQKFLLNPRLLDITPGVPSSKLEMLNNDLKNAFVSKDRAVLFVNDYISNVIRGEDGIIQDLKLPAGVEVRVIHGGVTQEERLTVQEEFQRGDKRILLVVSGKTADVAVDYSAGQEIIFYNEPWTIADKHQQQARVYRPGIEGDVESRTILTKGTIEEGKHEYIQVKHRAIEKLLKGIPITEVEMEILEKSEEAEKADLSVNPELADYYFSSFEKMNRIFASVKEIGEKKFSTFLEKHGAEYADCYRELGSRSYQSNASRVVATVLTEMANKQGIENPRILDLASGPEMLRRHSKDTLRSNIISLDINPEHFANKTPESETIVGSFTDIPLESGSVDYVNLSLALHYTKLVPSKGEYERLEALKEMSRVLKSGGRAVVNMIYSLDFRDTNTLTTIAKQFGLDVVNEYSGEISSGNGYRSRMVTFEKNETTPETVTEVLDNLSKEDLDGFKLQRTDVSLKDSRKVLSHFTLGEREMRIELNGDDEVLAREEASIFQEVEALKTVHGSVQEIPKETIVDRGFVRIRTGRNKYILFKKIPGAGAVIAR